MKYKNYEIDYDSVGFYIAKSPDDDLQMISFSLSRLQKAIDQLWSALRYLDGDAMKLLDVESLTLPGWIRTWLRSDDSKVDIDRAFATGQL